MHRLNLQRLLPLIGILVVAVLLSRMMQASSDYPLLGEPLPAIEAAGWLEDRPPGELAGRVVVIDCWASWCGPCAFAAPGMVDLYKKYRGRDVLFLGLTPETAESLDEIRDFVAYYHIPWPIGYGAGETLQAIEGSNLPTVIIVGRDGRIAYGSAGWSEESDKALDQAIARVLAES